MERKKNRREKERKGEKEGRGPNTQTLSVGCRFFNSICHLYIKNKSYRFHKRLTFYLIYSRFRMNIMSNVAAFPKPIVRLI